MPIPAAALFAGGVNLAGQGLNALFQGGQNRKQRKWAEKQYDKQRRDALMDRDYQNWYDSPSEQMRRLKEGGLNPHLAYGSGTVANTGSVTRATNTDAWNPTAPQFDLGSVMGSYYDTQIKQAQVDNVKAQNELINMQALLTNYKAAKEGTDLRMTSDAAPGNMFEDLLKTQFEAAKAQLHKVKAETQVTINRDEREALASAQSLKEGLERILTMRQGRQLSQEQKRSIEQDVELKRLDIELRRKWNLSASDPIWIRLITPFLEKFGLSN